VVGPPPEQQAASAQEVDMIGYIVRRLVSSFLVIVLTSMVVFALFFLGPTDAAQVLCQKQGRCTAERAATLAESLGLNDSVVNQYGLFAKGLFVGRDVTYGSATYKCPAPCLGVSFITREPVTEIMTKRFPATLSLALGGAAIYLTLGVILGVIAARFRGSSVDRGLVTVSLLVSSIPYYIVALLVYLQFVTQWGLFQNVGYNAFLSNPWTWATGLLLPWLALGITGCTAYARYSRGAMVETLNEDYVRTATAKGVRARQVVLKHALRAAIVPIITIFGLDFAYLLAGTIFTEKIFQIDGIGNKALTSIFAFDFPVIQGTVLFGAVIIVTANLVVDVLYSVIDPRVRLG
jgi:peptide/nickel transport system permease protein